MATVTDITGNVPPVAAALVWCGPCNTHHIPLSQPCPPVGSCPDCQAPAGRLCCPDCPRYAEMPDGSDEGESDA